MNPESSEDLGRLEELFHSLRGVLEADRPGEAERLAPSNPTLAARALKLVQVFERTQGNRLEPTSSPTRFGPYRLTRVLGSGGMGTVYLAERADGQFEHQVALKVIAGGLEGGPFQERFLVERQILAALNHPNITKLLDGGTTSEGVPYLVMEYVDGQPIDQYCDNRKLSLTVRLKLFLKVCDAVDYAHRNLIVHRDLKPPNILVTGEGVPKLLDFGTARLHDSGNTAVHTIPLLTPRYSSPEQLRGGPAHVATDVYSLGIILYELLTGAWPFGDATAEAVLERMTLETSPGTPQLAVTARAAELRSDNIAGVREQLSGDLASVLTMALEYDLNRRYSSVREFAGDLERYLAAKPVLARKQTFLYRSAKFVRRNRWYVAAGGVVAAAVIAASVVSIRYGRAAIKEADRARKIAHFTTQTLLAASPAWFSPLQGNAGEITLGTLLDNAARRAGLDLADDPGAEVEIRSALAAAWNALGNDDKALVQLKAALEKADQVTDRPLYNERAGLLELYCNVDSANGDYKRARLHCQEALEAIVKAAQPDHDLAVSVRHDLAFMSAKDDAPPEEVEHIYREAADAAQRYFSTKDIHWLITMTRVGICRLDAGDLSGAGAILEPIVTQLRSMPGPPVDLIPALRALAGIRRTEGRLKAAQALFEEAIDLIHKRPTAYFSSDLMELDLLLVKTLEGTVADPVARSRKLLDATTISLPAGHVDRARPEIVAARILTLAHRPGEAEPLLRDAASIFGMKLPHWPGQRAEALSALAGSLAAQGKAEEAAATRDEALRLFADAYGAYADTHPAVLSTRLLKP